MNHKPLAKTNPYLRNRKSYEKQLLANVITSTEIETGKVSKSAIRILKKNSFPRLIKLDGLK